MNNVVSFCVHKRSHGVSTLLVEKAERDLLVDDAYQAAIAANPKKDHVDSTLEWLLDPLKCPHCDMAIEVCNKLRCFILCTQTLTWCQHASGCTAMLCIKCKTTFCLYCRTTFVDTKVLKASDACHNHIWECGKAPLRSALCTDSILFPANESDEDFIMCYQNCHKLALLQQIVCGNWSSREIKRLVLNNTFQSFLVHLKERQGHYRGKYPEKKDLLRMCFHKVIGVKADFVFDVSNGFPSWVSDRTEEEDQRAELFQKLRSEAKVQSKAEADAQLAGRVLYQEQRAAAAWATKRADAIMHLKSMGVEEVQATMALEATLGDLDKAIAMLFD